MGKERRGREERGGSPGEGKGSIGAGREGIEGDGRLTLMRGWNRAADWLRPALINVFTSSTAVPVAAARGQKAHAVARIQQ